MNKFFFATLILCCTSNILWVAAADVISRWSKDIETVMHNAHDTLMEQTKILTDHRADPTYKKLYRSSTNRIIAGVCGGIGEYFAIDPIIIRLIFIVSSFYVVGIVIYLLAWLLIPLESH